MTRIRTLIFAIALLGVSPLAGQYEISLETFAEGLSSPTVLTNAGGDRMFVGEKRGQVRIIEADGTVLPQPFLDIVDRVRSNGGEQGLLGIAFHPNYDSTGWVFVNYTRQDGSTVVSRFTRDPSNPSRLNQASEFILLVIAQPFSNHNGGDLHFGPDGYLYIGMGDGGSGGDPMNFSQNGESLLGKMLRIDVNTGFPYAIPDDNPFVNDEDVLDEIWAMGLRNPWRFSFDRATGDMWIGDVGQGQFEEINLEPGGSPGGHNYGWRCWEGLLEINPGECGPSAEYSFPVYVYDNNRFDDGCSVTGGYVYRGSRYPVMQGDYIFTDYCSGRFWSLRADGSGNYHHRELLNAGDFDMVGFGEDAAGELFVIGISTGRVYRIVANCELDLELGVQDQLCPGVGDGELTATVSNPTGTVNYAWSNGATGAHIDSLLPGTYYLTITDELCELVDSAVVGESPVVPCDLGMQTYNLCAGDSLVLVAACPEYPGLALQWWRDGVPLAGAVADTLTVAEGGSYTVSYTGACELEGLGAITVTLIEVDTPVIAWTDTVVAGPGGYEAYIWTLNGEEYPEYRTDSVFPINGREGYYRLRVVDSLGCLSAWSDSIPVLFPHADNYRLGPLEMHPNPSSGELFVKIPARNIATTLRIVNLAGQELLKQRVDGGTSLLRLDLGSLTPGMYYLQLQTPKGFYTGKFSRQ